MKTFVFLPRLWGENRHNFILILWLENCWIVEGFGWRKREFLPRNVWRHVAGKRNDFLFTRTCSLKRGKGIYAESRKCSREKDNSSRPDFSFVLFLICLISYLFSFLFVFFLICLISYLFDFLFVWFLICLIKFAARHSYWFIYLFDLILHQFNVVEMNFWSFWNQIIIVNKLIKQEEMIIDYEIVCVFCQT